MVLHIPRETESRMPRILDRAGPLPAAHPEDGEPVRPGRIYVAPPDHHLMLERDRVRLSRGPRENHHRPAVDPLFRSAAAAYGPRVIGVVLTGALDDGTAGLKAISRLGGLAVVQEPDEALFPSMPQSALAHVEAAHRLPLAEIGGLLARETARSGTFSGAGGGPSGNSEDENGGIRVPDDVNTELAAIRGEQPSQQDLDRLGEAVPISCPECRGPLWEIRDGDLLRYRCRVGHAFTTETMLEEQSETLEDALYAALNALEERTELYARLELRSRTAGQTVSAQRFAERSAEVREQAGVIRRTLGL